MQPIQKILQGRLTKALTGKYCEVHPNIEKMNIDNEIVCPRCEIDNLNKEFEDNMNKQIAQRRNKRKYNVLEKQSILTDNTLKNATFGTYTTPTPKEEEVKNKAVAIFQKFKKGERVNPWFVGSVGTGKSHLAMAILKNVNELEPKDKMCLFVSVERMLMLIRSSFSNRESKYTEQYFVELLSEVDLLVLDDLGAEVGAIDTETKASNFVHKVLYGISTARMDKSTIITTNLSRASLTQIYDEKTISRLSTNFEVIIFDGMEDKRGAW